MVDNELLAAEELEFLLQHAEIEFSGDELTNLSHAENARVTIRGDLDKINLADIFQTLGMSRMEGILRVRNAHETREILFHKGQIRHRFPARSEGKRLGQRLVRSQLITADQLRRALIVQEQCRQPLGPILVEHEFISPEDLEKVANKQLQEDLFDLFTWTQGFFEFYKGVPDDPVLLERFEQAPEFDIAGVLMEVSSRAEEWEKILATVYSVDEIPVPAESVDTSALTEEQAAVLRQVDGQHSIRELAEMTLFGLYRCAMIVTQLYTDHHIGLANVEHLLRVAEESAASGNTKRALLILQTMQQHEDELTTEIVLATADLQDRCGDSKLAASTLLSCANRAEEPAERIEIAERARQLDLRSIDILRFLQKEYVEAGLTDTKGFFEVASELGEALSEKGAQDEALEAIAQLESANVRESAVLGHKARILHRAGKTSEAVDALLELAKIWKARNDRTRLVGLYEQILKIDPKRKDIARALRQLKTTKTRRYVVRVVLLLLLLGTVGAGARFFETWQEKLKVADVEQRVRDKLRVHDFFSAQQIVGDAVTELGPRDELDALRRAIAQAMKDSKHAQRAQKLQEIQKRTRQAGDDLAAGNVRKALIAYAEMLKDRTMAGEVTKIAAIELKRLRPLLHAQVEALEINMPRAPDELQDDATRKKILATLQQHLKGSTPQVALGLIELRDDPTLKTILGEVAHDQLMTLAQRLATLVQTARLRQQEYHAYQEKVNRQRRLDPLYLAAREHERKFEFEAALELYRRLEKEHPEQDDLKVYFKDQVNRYATIVRFLERIERANNEGDFMTAQGQYRSLRRSYSDIPFDRLVRLPFHVVTIPAGAMVRLDGQPIGKAPLVASHYPAAQTKVMVELPGFLPEQTIIHGDQVGLVRSTLAKAPDWTLKTRGTVERRPVQDGTRRIFLVDRAGIVYCIDSHTQEEVWRFETHDLSGFLTQPRPYQDLVLVGSVDGTVRALDRDNGNKVWERSGLPCQASPAVCGQFLVVATTKRKLVGLNLKQPAEPLTELMNLPADVRVDIQSLARTAIVTLHSGEVLRVNTKGKVLWRVTAPGGAPTGASVTPKALVIATDGGSVSAVSLARGQLLWTQRGLGEIEVAPGTGKDRVYVVGRRQATVLDLRTGNFIRAVPMRAKASCPPIEHDGKVFLGDRDGRVLVLDAKTLLPRYLLRGNGPVSSPPTPLANGTIVTCFDRKEMHAFLRLP